MASTIGGGCLCGNVRYESRQQPLRAVICHCSMCKRHSGAPALAFAIFATDGFAWVGQEPTWHSSSRHADRGFCSACGSSLAMREHNEPAVVEIYAGTLDTPSSIRIEDHVWVSEQVTWLKIHDGLPRYLFSKPHL